MCVSQENFRNVCRVGLDGDNILSLGATFQCPPKFMMTSLVLQALTSCLDFCLVFLSLLPFSLCFLSLCTTPSHSLHSLLPVIWWLLTNQNFSLFSWPENLNKKKNSWKGKSVKSERLPFISCCFSFSLYRNSGWVGNW